jgi:hypothetical protein
MKLANVVALICIIPMPGFGANCSLEQGYAEASYLQIKESAELGTAALRQIEQLRAFMDSRKWEPGKPMSEQMSVEEAGEFGRLQAQQQISVTKALFESRRDRDIRVIRKMAILADKISRYGVDDSVNNDPESEEFVLAAALYAARDLLEVDFRELAVEPDKECNLEVALANLAREAINEFAADEQISAAMKESTRLGNVLKEAGSPARVSQADKDAARAIQPTIERAQAILQRAQDLQRLSIIESASKRMLASLRQDQYESPGDMGYAGTTWKRWRDEGRIPDSEHQISGVLNYINTKIPAPIITEREEAKKLVPGN